MRLLTFITFFFLSIFIAPLSAQQDPVLFSVEGKPVHISEFKYIYDKTNGDKANYSKESIEEYLDLYTKFKLKVQRAKDMRLDTIPALIKELEGYRRQLANSYLVDKEVTQKLVDEAYQRSQYDVELSHIMVNLPKKRDEAAERAAYAKIMAAYQALEEGKSFESVVADFSEDENKASNKGRIGFFNAMFRAGFYDMETAAYNLKPGQYSKPIKTPVAYHIIYLNSKRPTRGEVETAHILIRTAADGSKDKEAEAKINAIYEKLRNEGDFEKLARESSEHKQTAEKGGYIGFISTNSSVDEVFKDQVFNLEKEGSFSKPFKSKVGWHIVKKLSTKDKETEDLAKRRIQTKIQNNAKGRAGKYSRQKIAEQAMINDIKKTAAFTENEKAVENLIASIDSNYTSHKWKAYIRNNDVLFAFGKDMKMRTIDFFSFSDRSSTRLRQGPNADPKAVARMVYEEFVNDTALKYEESQLENKYPEFKALMREYEEGILLFEATKMEVWDKASQDSIGLLNFYNKNKSKYRWKERAVVDEYTIKSGNPDKVKLLLSILSKNSNSKQVLNLVDPQSTGEVVVKQRTYERGRNDKIELIEWKKGNVTPAIEDVKKKTTQLMVIKEVKKPSIKSLDEARGYVIADYQDFLEDQWINKLKNTYKVKVNQKTLNKLIQ